MANSFYQTLLQTDSPYAAMVRTLTQYMYQLHSYRFAKALSSAGTPVYMYRYSYQDGREFGARHGDELHYIWGAARILTSNDKAAKKQLAGSLHGAWAAFIKTGDPDGTGIPQWPAYKDTDRQVMVFSDVDTVTRLQEVYDDKHFPSAVFVIK
jgi:para-nitrobenzyl esterase